MTLSRMPVFAWAMLVVAFVIVFAFPAVIAGTTLLEMERAFPRLTGPGPWPC